MVRYTHPIEVGQGRRTVLQFFAFGANFHTASRALSGLALATAAVLAATVLLEGRLCMTRRLDPPQVRR